MDNQIVVRGNLRLSELVSYFTKKIVIAQRDEPRLYGTSDNGALAILLDKIAPLGFTCDEMTESDKGFIQRYQNVVYYDTKTGLFDYVLWRNNDHLHPVLSNLLTDVAEQFNTVSTGSIEDKIISTLPTKSHDKIWSTKHLPLPHKHKGKLNLYVIQHFSGVLENMLTHSTLYDETDSERLLTALGHVLTYPFTDDSPWRVVARTESDELINLQFSKGVAEVVRILIQLHDGAGTEMVLSRYLKRPKFKRMIKLNAITITGRGKEDEYGLWSNYVVADNKSKGVLLAVSVKKRIHKQYISKKLTRGGDKTLLRAISDEITETIKPMNHDKDMENILNDVLSEIKRRL